MFLKIILFINYLLVIYHVGDFIYYQSTGRKLGFLRSIQRNEDQQIILKIQHLIFYEELPGNFKGINWQQRSNSGEVWIFEENFISINPSRIICKAMVKLSHLKQNLLPGDLYVSEIIYKYNNC